MQTNNSGAFAIGLGVVGGIVGAFVGNPMLGFKLGMMAGMLIFQPKIEDQAQVVKPSAIQIPTCELGIAIPVFYGTFGPISGNVVYFGNKRKISHEVEQESEGKGGSPPAQSNTYYTWSVDFCMVLGWGTGTVLRCYSGGKEVPLSRFRIYDGTQTTSDAIFATKSRQPVYKGLIIVCAEQYNLGQSGQFPLFQFDVARKHAVPAVGTAEYTGDAMTAIGGIDTYGDDLYAGGGSSTTAPLINIYDSWIWRDDTVPATIPAAASAIAVSPDRAFLLEWTANPLKIYIYTRSTMAYVDTIDLTGTANRIHAIRCSESTLFVCYTTAAGAIIMRRYRLSDLSAIDTSTITGVTAGRVIADIAISPSNYYLADSANDRVWDVSRATLAATERTIDGGTAYGVTIDLQGNIWVAAGAENIYIYTTAWALSATVTDATITAAQRVRLLENRHRMAVMNKSGDGGSIAVLSSGQLTIDVTPDFAFERSWTIKSNTTNIPKLAASENMVAAIESPSNDIYIYSPTGDTINTITGTFNDIAINDLGVYAITNGNTVAFYADGTAAADTRDVAADVGTIVTNGLLVIAVGNDSPGGLRRLYIAYKETADPYIYMAAYTLAADGKVSTATFNGMFNLTPPGVLAASVVPTALSASRDGYGLLMVQAGAIRHWDPSNAYWTMVAGAGDGCRDVSWISDSPRFITCTLAKILTNGGTGVPSKEYVDASRFTTLNEVVYAGGRIYAADQVAAAGQSRILVYVTENHPLSTVGERLPNEISYDMLTNTAYGAGISAATIDRTGEPLVASYAARHDCAIAPVYGSQMPVTDFLEELCAHHNGFIRVLNGKLAHGQFYYDPFDDDCSFTEITAKSDAFTDGSIGSQWTQSNNTADQVEGSGYLTLSPEASEEAWYAGSALTYGAFDFRVGYASFAVTSGGSALGYAILEFYIDALNYCYVGRRKSASVNQYVIGVVVAGTPTETLVTTTDTAATIRLVRKGQTIYGYYGSTLIGSFGSFSALGGVPRLYATSAAGVTTTVRFDNYTHYESLDAIYPEHIVTEVLAAEGGSSETQSPVVVSTAGSRDRPNQITVEFSRQYVANMPDTFARATDIVDVENNTLVTMTLRLSGIRRAAAARFMAHLYLMKAIAQQDTIQFEVGWQHELQAGSLYWLTYPNKELDHVPVRVVSQEMTPVGTRKVTAAREEDIYDPEIYADDIPVYPTSLIPEYPGDVENLAAILMAPEYSAPLDYDLDFFYTRPLNESWAGAALYQAYAEAGDYVLKMTSPRTAIQGRVSAVGDSAGTKYIDIILYTDDDLVSLTAIASMFENLVYINGHYIQFETAELQSGTTWRISDLTYDANTAPVDNSYGTVAAAESAIFYVRRPMTLDIPDADLGVPLWFKVASVNDKNLIQPLSDVTAITVTVAARNTIPAIGEYTEGTPAALVGDAVHFEKSDGYYYRADPFVRSNVVGIKDGTGLIVQQGPARRLPALTAGSQYYLKCPTVAELDLYSGCNFTGVNNNIVPSTPMCSQSFQVTTSKKVVLACYSWLYKVGTPNFKVCVEIRPDDSGHPHNTTVLCKSEWIPASDFPTASGKVFFRFFEYVALVQSTTYHLVFRVDGPINYSWGEENYVRVVVGNNAFVTGSHWYWSASGGNWVERSTYDVPLAFYLASVDDTSAVNITITHPFDTANYAPIMGHLPIQKIGIASSATEMMVNIDRSWPETVFKDWATTYSGDAVHNVATIDLLSAEKILVLFHFWATTSGDNTEAQVYLDDIAGTLFEYDLDVAPFQQMFRAQVFNEADLKLSARKYLYIDLGDAGTPLAGRITVLAVTGPSGASNIPVVPNNSLVPVGGTSGQVLTKSSSTDYDGAWADVDATPDAGSITNAMLATAVVGDYIAAQSAADASTTETAYTKLKEIRINRAGNYRILFNLRRGAAGTAYGRIYKNGSAVGTEQTATTDATKTEDINGWAVGDLIQIYAKHSTGSYNTVVSLFKVCENAPMVPAVVL